MERPREIVGSLTGSVVTLTVLGPLESGVITKPNGHCLSNLTWSIPGVLIR
jgi:hypothetical protein